jgi:type IV fimbrial biogenesis protein FimT
MNRTNHKNRTNRTNRNTLTRRSRGFTLIDFMIALTIVGILLGQAIPSWSHVFADKRLTGEADLIASAIHLARTETVSRNEGVSFSVLSTPGGATCHVVHTGRAGDCSCADDGTARCVAPGSVIAAAVHHASVRASLAHSIRFDPRNGTATPTGTVVVRSDAGREVQNRVNITGRVRTCTTTGGLAGVARCAP